MLNTFMTLRTLLFSGAKHFFNGLHTIYPKLLRTFWRNVEFVNKKTIASKVLGVQIMLSNDIITKATGCLREGSTYQEGWEKNYDSHVTRALYWENIEKAGDQKTTVYNLMCEKAKIWANILNKSVLYKADSKTTLLDLHKFVLFHLMENLPFDLPHTIYINI